MKKLIFIIFGCLLSFFLQAQSLIFDCNQPRGGDRLIKRMVTTNKPGESGVEQIWDFSELELQDADYELRYTAQGMIRLLVQNIVLCITIVLPVILFFV